MNIDYETYYSHIAKGGKTIHEIVEAHNQRVTKMIEAGVDALDPYTKALEQFVLKLKGVGVTDYFV